ncbi:MAG: hypothetical protein RSC90_10670 [Clostridia bacterium]
MPAWIEFNGIRSTDMGVKIESLPADCAPKRRYVKETVPGRSGALMIDEGGYEPVVLTAVLNTAGTGNARAINAWLTGAGDLILSDTPNYCRRAVAIDGIAYKRLRIRDIEAYDTLTIKFQCDPFLYESDPESFLLDTNPKTLVNPGTVPAEPLLVISGTGRVVVTVGGVSVTLDGLVAGSPITIDCDAKCAYKGAIANQVSMTLNDHAWPTLPIGDTTIGWAGNASVKITPHWRWL